MASRTMLSVGVTVAAVLIGGCSTTPPSPRAAQAAGTPSAASGESVSADWTIGCTEGSVGAAVDHPGGGWATPEQAALDAARALPLVDAVGDVKQVMNMRYGLYGANGDALGEVQVTKTGDSSWGWSEATTCASEQR